MACIEARGLRKVFGATVALDGELVPVADLELSLREPLLEVRPGRKQPLVVVLVARVGGTQDLEPLLDREVRAEDEDGVGAHTLTMRKLGVGPDWYVNSAHAVTGDGTIVVASNTGSQLAPLAFGAGEVIFAIGSQKLVPDLETAMRRLETHTLPLENVRMQGIYGTDSEIKKVLIIHKEFRPGRFTVVLIKEPVGF